MTTPSRAVPSRLWSCPASRRRSSTRSPRSMPTWSDSSRSRTTRDAALKTLTDALNAHLGSEVYKYIATGKIGTDVITTALMYKPATVEPLGAFTLMNGTVELGVGRLAPPPGAHADVRLGRDRREVHRRRQPPEVEGIGLRHGQRPAAGQLQRTRAPRRPRRSRRGWRPTRPARTPSAASSSSATSTRTTRKTRSRR